MQLRIERLPIAQTEDGKGALMFSGDAVIGVLAQHSADHEALAGKWVFEWLAGGRVYCREQLETLDCACIWVQSRKASFKSARAA